MLTLMRATPENGHFTALDGEWSLQLRGFGEDPKEYESPLFEHAREISSETPQDAKYGLFVIRDTAAEVGYGYKGMVHINHALPGCTHATVRMVWMLMAPIFDFADPNLDELADIASAFLDGGLALCRHDMPSNNLRMHLSGAMDRSFAAGLARGLQRMFPSYRVAIKGNWLHVDNIGGLTAPRVLGESK